MGSDVGRDAADIIFDVIAQFQREHPSVVKECVLVREATAWALRAKLPEIDLVYTLHVVPENAMPETFVGMKLYGGAPVCCPICGRGERLPS